MAFTQCGMNTSELVSKIGAELEETGKNKSSYFRVKLKRIKFELYTEPDLDQT